MTRIPNGDRALVENEKLTGYILNPAHPTGRHKARVFAASLGLTVQHAEDLAQALRAAAASSEDGELVRTTTMARTTGLSL